MSIHVATIEDYDRNGQVPSLKMRQLMIVLLSLVNKSQPATPVEDDCD
jgi:hypothetical protein